MLRRAKGLSLGRDKVDGKIMTQEPQSLKDSISSALNRNGQIH